MSNFLVEINNVVFSLAHQEQYEWVIGHGAIDMVSSDRKVDVEVINDTDGIVFGWCRYPNKNLSVRSDALKLFEQQSSFPAAKQGAFNQAIGKKTKTVLDATGGWGFDSMLMCAQGYKVVIVERHPLIALMLQAMLDHLATNPRFRSSNLHLPELVCADSKDYMQGGGEMKNIDCIYLDPMFPPKRKKSAVPNKKMQFLAYLLERSDGVSMDEGDIEAISNNTLLAELACNSSVRRVVVKRPTHAAPLLESPNTQFSSKLLNYDVYLNHNAA